MSASVAHLARRFVRALGRSEPVASDVKWAASWLSDAELDLWSSMPAHDRRHAIDIARRYVAVNEKICSRDEMAAALLHDVGKAAAGLGVFGRVVATVVGPRGRRFGLYHDHESIGASMCRQAGSSDVTCSMIDGTGPAEYVIRLRQADDI